MTVNQRIEEIIKYLDLNPSSFSKAIGLTGNSTISRIIKGNSTPSYETLSMIYSKYEWIDIHWLMTGEGQMIRSDQNKENKTLDELKEKIEYQKELIKTLKETLDMINQNFKNT